MAMYGCTSPNEPNIESTIRFPFSLIKLSDRVHIARAHDAQFACVGFDTQSAVGFKPAGRARKSFRACLDAHALARGVRRGGAPRANGLGGAPPLVPLVVA